MKNKLSDLNDHLFAQLERLSEEGLSADDLEREVKRSQAIVSVADKIASNHDTALKAARLFGEYGTQILPMLPMIGKTGE